MISVLLPTLNRLEFLRLAVESVRRQDDEDWEIVVSDNDSTDDIAGYVEELDDPRVRYVRTDRLVSVTDNWNLALQHSRGDYVVMLGDDDALLPGYFTAMRRLIADFDAPDVIYTGALVFAYPGVLPDGLAGYSRSGSSAPFLVGAKRPFKLDHEVAAGLVKDAMGFRATYPYNMQYVCVKRSTIEAAQDDGGEFYRSPFPDFYAMNLMFATAPSIVIDPEPRVAIGITKSSYGFLHFNNREAEAMALLHNDATDPETRRQVEPHLLPGTNLHTGWLLAMEALANKLDRREQFHPDYQRYRFLQAIDCYQRHYIGGSVSKADLAVLRGRQGFWEGLTFRVGMGVVGPLARLMSDERRRRAGRLLDLALRRQAPGERPQLGVGRYENIVEMAFDQSPDSVVQLASASR